MTFVQTRETDTRPAELGERTVAELVCRQCHRDSTRSSPWELFLSSETYGAAPGFPGTGNLEKVPLPNASLSLGKHN